MGQMEHRCLLQNFQGDKKISLLWLGVSEDNCWGIMRDPYSGVSVHNFGTNRCTAVVGLYYNSYAKWVGVNYLFITRNDKVQASDCADVNAKRGHHCGCIYASGRSFQNMIDLMVVFVLRPSFSMFLLFH